MKEGYAMKKWKVIAPLGLAAVGALAAGVATLLRKPKEEAAAPGAKAAPAAKAGPQKALQTGSYSFISGFKDAATVELTFQYDPEVTDYSVVEEGFLCYSSASHVAIIHSEDFRAQIEYAPFYAGENFESFVKNAGEKFKDVAPVRYAELEGIQYGDGDSICLCFAIPGDDHSYIQVNLFKLADDDDPITVFPQYPAVKALFDSARILIQH